MSIQPEKMERVYSYNPGARHTSLQPRSDDTYSEQLDSSVRQITAVYKQARITTQHIVQHTVHLRVKSAVLL